MGDLLERVWDNLVDRTTGPMWFRLVLQPVVAILLGVRAGRANARRIVASGSRPRVFDPAHRRAMFLQTCREAGRPLIIGVVLDVIYQVIALRTVYPGEAVLVAFVLVVVPFHIVRTVIARKAR
jgi:hypothetical protein